MSTDSTKRTIIVALGVCLVCSVLVSTATVILRPVQEINKKLDKLKNILLAAGLYNEGTDIEKIFNQKIQTDVIDLSTGNSYKSENPLLKPENFDIKTVSDSKELGRLIESGKDIAQIKKMPKYMVIYKVYENNELQKIILPVYGKGLWSTMYGFLAVDKDFSTIKGFTFYEHGETPGLGGEIENPKWQQLWVDKKAYDENRNVIIEVIKGKVDPASADANHKIDGLSGATITTGGVDKLVKFWLGSEGYGPFINKMIQGGK